MFNNIILFTTDVQFLSRIWETQSYKSIDVNKAYQMINDNYHYPNLILLDVRSEQEFYASHLYNAHLIPYDNLESQITDLEDYKEYEIIVYCKSGIRSCIASDILVKHEFLKVYNLLGGIIAWVENDYSIWAVSHSVNIESPNSILISPFIPDPAPDCGCSCLDSFQEGSCSGDIRLIIDIINDNENNLTFYSTIIIDGITHEILTRVIYLYKYAQISEDYSEKFQFNSIEIFAEESKLEFFTLKYEIESKHYNLTVLTILTPLNSESYNIATTLLIFTTPEESLHTVEFIDFDYTPVSLSDLYSSISGVAKSLKSLYISSYKLSGDLNFKQLGKNYNIIENELKTLSKLVKVKIYEYNLLIQENYATIRDACNPAMLLLCWVTIHGIELMGCSVVPAFFCMITGIIFWATIGPYSILWDI